MSEEKEQNTPKKEKVKLDTHQTYGAVLRQAMEIYRWTGAKLGAQVGCTRNHISEITSGKNPSYMLGQQICDVFGYELRWCKKPSIPKSPRKKKESPVSEEPISEAPSPAPAPETVSGSNPSSNGTAKEKLRKLKDLQEKTSASKKETEG